MNVRALPAIVAFLSMSAALVPFDARAQQAPFQAEDVFEIEYASDVQISPDAGTVAYVRYGMSIMRDRREGRLWMVNTDGSGHRKVTSEDRSESSPRWSPDGTRLAFVASSGEGSEVFVHWAQTGQTARLTQLERSPRGLAWSPDGSHIAFTMLVPEAREVLAAMPSKPAGAEWADPPIVETRVRHEADGQGVIEPGFSHIFVIPSDGGSPRQVTSGDFQHGTPVWDADGRAIVFSANREPGWEYENVNSELYRVSLDDGGITALTTRTGPDRQAAVSPDGATIAYTGYDDRIRTYQTGDLHLMSADGTGHRPILTGLDRTVGSPTWSADGAGIYFSYDDEGISKVGYTTPDGDMRVVAEFLGGTAVGRPYGGGNYSVAANGTVAYTHTRSDDPSEVAIVTPDGSTEVLTDLNGDLKRRVALGTAEMIWSESSYDGRPVQSWIVHPPGFDPEQQYPLILEIHGGPISNYGDRFSAEVQMYAAAGYVVLYSNPRGSTSYGEEFGDLLYHDYPGNDYDDLVTAVDDVVERGYIDTDRLYVTGGSAGGIMTAWIVGHTDRFAAAVVTKPVVNWISKTLVADNYNGYMHYRYPGTPWENPEDYWEFSPLSVVGDIETPTMVMVGTADLRTPLSEAKQLYHALKLRRIDTALVQIPGAFHNIANRPSQLIAKVLNTVAWFDRYPGQGTPVSQQ